MSPECDICKSGTSLYICEVSAWQVTTTHICRWPRSVSFQTEPGEAATSQGACVTALGVCLMSGCMRTANVRAYDTKECCRTLSGVHHSRHTLASAQKLPFGAAQCGRYKSTPSHTNLHHQRGRCPRYGIWSSRVGQTTWLP